jgi:hypothetical protein
MPEKEELVEEENIRSILDSAIKAIKEKDVILLKDLSSRTLHSASVYQDPDSISVAVIIYSLSKIYERSKYQTFRQWDIFDRIVLSSLKDALSALKSGETEFFRKNLELITNSIKKVSGHFRVYIEEVFEKARINKASRLYEHGISVEQTAQLLGISLFDLADYAGKTGIGDVDLSITMPIKTRIKIALDFFK